MRILAVSDSANWRARLSTKIHEFGFEVDVLSCTTEFSAYVAQSLHHAVVLHGGQDQHVISADASPANTIASSGSCDRRTGDIRPSARQAWGISRGGVDVLEALVSASGRGLPSAVIILSSHTLENVIRRIRKKLSAAGAHNPIETRSGLGYVMP